MNGQELPPVEPQSPKDQSLNSLGVSLGTETDWSQAETILTRISNLPTLSMAEALTAAFDEVSADSALPHLSLNALAAYGQKLRAELSQLSPEDKKSQLGRSSRYDSPFFSLAKNLRRVEWTRGSRTNLADGVIQLLTAVPEIEAHIYPLVGTMLGPETDWFVLRNHLLPIISKMSPQYAAESLTFALGDKDCNHQTMSQQTLAVMTALGDSLHHQPELNLFDEHTQFAIGDYFNAVARALTTQPAWQERRTRKAVVEGLGRLIQDNPKLSEAAYILVGRLVSAETMPISFERIIKLIGKMEPMAAVKALKLGFRSAKNKPESPSLLPRFAANAIDQLGKCLPGNEQLAFGDYLELDGLFSEILVSLDLPEWNLFILRYTQKALNNFLTNNQTLELHKGSAGRLKSRLQELIQ